MVIGDGCIGEGRGKVIESNHSVAIMIIKFNSNVIDQEDPIRPWP